MKAIILAAGRGSRMGERTNDSPKCLLEVNGTSLLDRQICAIHEAGIADIGVVTGYKAELIRRPGLTYFHNAVWQNSNMVESLMAAHEWLESEVCFVGYADLLYDADVVTLLKNSAAEIAITYDVNWLELWQQRFDDPLEDAESFKVNDSGLLVDIGQKEGALGNIQGQYMGLLRIMPSAWRRIQGLLANLDDHARMQMDMTSMLRMLLSNVQEDIRAIPYAGRWGEVDSVADLRLYETSNYA